jgi:radical SAM superfamily enzyme YgiQ (UPF0313 family)
MYPYPKKGFVGCNPPISILYLAASLRQAGEDVIVIDVDHGDLSTARMVKRLVGYAPDLIGIPLFSSHLRQAHNLVQALDPDRFGWKILLGGPHATARPQEVLEAFDKCDYVLRGESEQSLVELVRSLRGGGDLDSIKGLSYRLGDHIINNPDAPVNRDLDSIPFPARDLLSDAYGDGTYWRMGHKGVTDVMISSRGCPYRCNFCFKISSKFRMRSPENILEELVYIRSQGTRNVHIMDDLFVFHKARCLKVLSLIKEQRLNMEFKVRARVDRIDDELLVAMKETGVKSVVYGIESGSQTVLDAMNKRTTVEMNYSAIAMTKKAGLQCYADLFLGFPGETPDTIRETAELLMKAKPTAINMSVMYPLPGTTVYDQCRERGTLIGDWGVGRPRPWIKLPWTEDSTTLWKIRNRLHKDYLYNPVVVLNVLRFLVFRLTFQQIKTILRYYYTVTFKLQR